MCLSRRGSASCPASCPARQPLSPPPRPPPSVPALLSPLHHSRVEEGLLVLLPRADLHLLQLHHRLELGRALLLLAARALVVAAVAAVAAIAALRARLRLGQPREAAEPAGARAKGGGGAEDGRGRGGLRAGIASSWEAPSPSPPDRRGAGQRVQAQAAVIERAHLCCLALGLGVCH